MIAFANAPNPIKPAFGLSSATISSPALTDNAFAMEVFPDKLANLPDSVWRANQMGASKAYVQPSGYACLDQELPNGGWPASVLIELLLSQNGVGELRLLAPTMAALTQAGKTVILLAPPHIPFAPALVELGLDLQHVLLIQAEKPMDRIWAVEQTLKSAGFGALLCWLPQVRPDHLRRLQLAAGSSEGLCFVFRPATVQHESSPAPLRLTCRASRCGEIEVDIIKRRGPLASKPMILPLQVPTCLKKPFARQAAVAIDLLPQVVPVAPTAIFPISITVADHAVDSPEPAAAAARYRTAVTA